MKQNIEWIKTQIDVSSKVFKQMVNICSEEILASSEIITESLDRGNKIFWCGNGGSAGQSQHLSAELVCGLRSHKRSALASISLTTDTSVLTCIANDFGYDKIFERQLEGLGKKGDILIAMSTSGKSKNIINLLKMAKKLNIKSICLLGYNGGICKKLSDYNYIVPSNSTANIQEVHHLIGHIFCSLVD